MKPRLHLAGSEVPTTDPTTRSESSLPGAVPVSAALRGKLEATRDSAAGDKPARTKHKNPDGSPRYTNRLILESSLYLRQHSHNPVNWFPWAEEAFELARELHRPVLLSVGYSTCHWCNVMEEESFEDLEIAEFLNRHYVAVKVDREERPDVDAIYMTAVRMMAGNGGWPMTVWLTDKKAPFFAGTYFPARDGDRGAHMGFLTLLQRIQEEYEKDAPALASSAQVVVSRLKSHLEASPSGAVPQAAVAATAMDFYRRRFDRVQGGLFGAPKFPSSLPTRFLLRYARRTRDDEALQMANVTLEKMAAGGMYDQVGGGFHRYSTDPHWLVPHFEKMLYDNALLSLAYLEAFQVTQNDDHVRVVRQTLDYVLREMTSPNGGFYSASDADSETPNGQHDEGYYFTWTRQELEQALTPGQLQLAEAYFGVTREGNFEGRNVLHRPSSDTQVSELIGIDAGVLRDRVEVLRQRLYELRSKRPPPARDDKILTAWNGLMISAMARASSVLRKPEYLDAAVASAERILASRDERSRLGRTVGGGANSAYLDDYACFIAGLLDLYEATFDANWLEQALALNSLLRDEYHDAAGGYYMTPSHHESLLARAKPAEDAAEPSGNSVQALNLLRLYGFTTDEQYRRDAEGVFSSVGTELERSPASLSEMLLALEFLLDVPKEILIVAAEGAAIPTSLLDVVQQTFVPNKVLCFVHQGSDLETQARLIPLLDMKVARDGQPTAYVCERGSCKRPTSDPRVFLQQLTDAPTETNDAV